MLLALHWLDHAVIGVYLAAMLGMGLWLARRTGTRDDFYLGGRRLPWFAVGLSVIASLLSSLTYLSEPGEVWNSGAAHLLGKLAAIPLEMLVVWVFCIPFLMRFRYTSAYEYLEHRFGLVARRTGAALFCLQSVLWMGFVVLVTARALTTVTQIPLEIVILTVGAGATIYTVLGGMRAVVWTDVVQVGLLLGGGLATISYVAWATGLGPADWYAAAARRLEEGGGHALPFFSPDPWVRATIVTVALNMTVWHICTHLSNQMTVQRYFSTRDERAARRSFLVGSLMGALLNTMLLLVGLAVLFFYVSQSLPLEAGLDVSKTKDRDLIFLTFAVHRLPPGLGGAVVAALLAAAMSSIDSAVNSISAVADAERRRSQTDARGAAPADDGAAVAFGRWVTLLAGAAITCAAYGLNFLPDRFGIVDSLPRSFNAVTAPLGGLFLTGMFLRRVRQGAALAGTVCGLLTAVGLGYLEEWTGLAARAGLLAAPLESISFTWIMPSALTATLVFSLLFSFGDRSSAKPLAGLTWRS